MTRFENILETCIVGVIVSIGVLVLPVALIFWLPGWVWKQFK